MIKNTEHLTKLQFITDLVAIKLQLRAISFIHEDMCTKWNASVDQLGNHLIKNINMGSTKTDACKSYLTVLIHRFQTANGLTLQPWCRVSLCTESMDSHGGLASASTGLFKTHNDLFRHGLSRILLIDPLLCDAALLLIKGDEVAATKLILAFLISKYGTFYVAQVTFSKGNSNVGKAELNGILKEISGVHGALVQRIASLNRDEVLSLPELCLPLCGADDLNAIDVLQLATVEIEKKR